MVRTAIRTKRTWKPRYGFSFNATECDGTHGLWVWGLATLLTAVLALDAVQAMTRLAAPSSGPAGPGTSVAGEKLIAYELDQLFRGSRPGEADMNYSRAEAARILLAASSHWGISADLVRLVASRTGLFRRTQQAVSPRSRRALRPTLAGSARRPCCWRSRRALRRSWALRRRGLRLAPAAGTAMAKPCPR
jgi:hypothetical protein